MSSHTSTASSSSSRETSPEEYDDKEEAEERLKALEKLLALQFFAAPEEEEEEEAQIDDRPKKKRKKEMEEVEVTPDQIAQDAVVEVEETVGKKLDIHSSPDQPFWCFLIAAFRLFSTQTGLQTVIIREKEENDIVLDPRIR